MGMKLNFGNAVGVLMQLLNSLHIEFGTLLNYRFLSEISWFKV